MIIVTAAEKFNTSQQAIIAPCRQLTEHGIGIKNKRQLGLTTYIIILSKYLCICTMSKPDIAALFIYMISRSV